MAICRPKTIGDAPVGPERSGGCRRGDFLASRGRAKPGEESRHDGVAAQTIEAQPVCGQIEPSQRPGGRVLNHKPGKRWLASVRPGKRALQLGVGKETKGDKSGSRRRKANRKRKLQDRVGVHPSQSTLPYRSSSEEAATISRSSSLLRLRRGDFSQSVGVAGGEGSSLVRCGCENWLRTAFDCLVRTERAGLG